jgi:hypothetical protein
MDEEEIHASRNEYRFVALITFAETVASDFSGIPKLQPSEPGDDCIVGAAV